MLAVLPAASVRTAPLANLLFGAALVAAFLLGGGGAEGFDYFFDFNLPII